MIVNQLKPIFSRSISKENFGLLDGRKIHEAIEVAQETLHSIKLSHKRCMVVKIDLSKAYEKII